jgi:hypothetical protein
MEALAFYFVSGGKTVQMPVARSAIVFYVAV